MLIRVNDKKVKIIERDFVNSGELNVHKCNFDFSEEYNDLIKKAIFMDEQKNSYVRTITNNICNIPTEILSQKGLCKIGVYGYELDENENEVLRYSPKPTLFYINEGSYVGNNSSMIVDTSTGTIEPKDVVNGKIGFSKGEEIVGTLKTEIKNVKSTLETQIITPTTSHLIDEIIVEPLELETKSTTITSNGTSTIAKSLNKDGMSEVEINVNVPEPSGTYNIVENGNYNVKDYAEASVNVPMPSGTLNITQNGTYNVNDYAEADVAVPGIIPTGTYNIDQNGTYDVTNYANANVSVREPTGTYNITQNGTYNIKQYAEVDVNTPVPTGTMNITQNGNYDVSQYANASVAIDKNTKITTTFDNNASKPHNHIVEIPIIDTSAVTNGNQMFEGYQQLVTLPQIDTSSMTSFQYMFRRCYALTNVPILDTHLVTIFRDTFTDCTSLSNQSLDNILVMCINATSYTGTKRLSVLGIRTTTYSQELIESLPHYQDFVDAGWTISG